MLKNRDVTTDKPHRVNRRTQDEAIMHISRQALRGVLLGCFSAVALVVFAITAHRALEWSLAVMGIAAFALFLLAQMWALTAAWKSSAREHQRSTTFQGRLRAAAATSGGWLYVIDNEKRFVYSSEASIDCVGYTPDELMGTVASDLLSPAELTKIVTRVGDGHPVNTLVVRARHRNGEDRWFEVTSTVVLDASTKATIGWSGTSRPLTDAKHPAILREIHRRSVKDILVTEQLTIAFQPIVDLPTGRMIGVEALSRFPSREGITPDVVFAEATNAGLGIESRLLDGSLYVSINVSPPVLANPSLLDALLASGVDLKRVVIEVTEHASIADYAPLAGPRQRLRELGVRLAIDDAGAGYASLRHIVALAPDMIKIDRALVENFDQDRARRALVMAVVMFAMEINGTTVIAEGVETVEELDALRLLGVDAGQGYLLGRPTTSPADWLGWGADSPISALA
jgi:PAS domain S-box-containing protein